MKELFRTSGFQLFLALIAIWGLYFVFEVSVQNKWQECLDVGECHTPTTVYEAADEYVKIRGGKLFSAQEHHKIQGPNWYLEANWGEIVCTEDHPVNYPPVYGELTLYVDGVWVETITTDNLVWYYYPNSKYEAVDHQEGVKLEWAVFVERFTWDCYKQTPYLTLSPTH